MGPMPHQTSAEGAQRTATLGGADGTQFRVAPSGGETVYEMRTADGMIIYAYRRVAEEHDPAERGSYVVGILTESMCRAAHHVDGCPRMDVLLNDGDLYSRSIPEEASGGPRQAGHGRRNIARRTSLRELARSAARVLARIREKRLNAPPGALPRVGSRYRLRQAVDRYPHFLAAAGATGVVSQAAAELVALRMDDPLKGSEEWDNEIHWTPEDGLTLVSGDPSGETLVAAAFLRDCVPVSHAVCQTAEAERDRSARAGSRPANAAARDVAAVDAGRIGRFNTIVDDYGCGPQHRLPIHAKPGRWAVLSESTQGRGYAIAGVSERADIARVAAAGIPDGWEPVCYYDLDRLASEPGLCCSGCGNAPCNAGDGFKGHDDACPRLGLPGDIPPDLGEERMPVRYGVARISTVVAFNTSPD